MSKYHNIVAELKKPQNMRKNQFQEVSPDFLQQVHQVLSNLHEII